jgi:GNAT superfamily N-acetyltransferase
MIRYYPVPVSEISHLFLDGKKEGLSFVPNTLYMGALEDGAVIGYGGLKIQGKQATLRNLYVLPGHRGRGVAKALTAHCLDWARKTGATTAIAFSNWNSKPLYLGMGAVELESGRYYGKIRFDLGGTP